jgi:hypothetical protein
MVSVGEMAKAICGQPKPLYGKIWMGGGVWPCDSGYLLTFLFYGPFLGNGHEAIFLSHLWQRLR